VNGTSGSEDDRENAQRVQAIRRHWADYRAETDAEQELLEEARRHCEQFRAQQVAAVAGMRERGLSRADIAEVTGLTRREITAALNDTRGVRSRTAGDAWERGCDADRHQPASGARDDSGHTPSAGTPPQARLRPEQRPGRDHRPAGRPSGNTAR